MPTSRVHPLLTPRFLRQLGVKVTELGELCGVTRVTASFWLHAKHYPSLALKGELDMVIQALQDARVAGDLPLRGVARKGRMDALRQIISKHAKVAAASTP